MDQFDQKIIAALKDNARQSVSAIAEQVNLSRTAVSERIRRMEEKGDILGYRVITAEEQDSPSLIKACLQISHGGFKCAPLVQYMKKYPQVKSCYGVSGEVDLLVMIEAFSMQTLHDILADIDNKLPKEARMVTHMVMKEWHHDD